MEEGTRAPNLADEVLLNQIADLRAQLEKLEQDENVQCYNGQLYYIGTQGNKVSLHMQYHDFMTSVLRFYILDY